MAITLVLESIHGLSRVRPHIAWAPMVRDGRYQVRTAECGCSNRTYVVPGCGPSCDGITHLCEEHALAEDD